MGVTRAGEDRGSVRDIFSSSLGGGKRKKKWRIELFHSLVLEEKGKAHSRRRRKENSSASWGGGGNSCTIRFGAAFIRAGGVILHEFRKRKKKTCFPDTKSLKREGSGPAWPLSAEEGEGRGSSWALRLWEGAASLYSSWEKGGGGDFENPSRARRQSRGRGVKRRRHLVHPVKKRPYLTAGARGDEKSDAFSPYVREKRSHTFFRGWR